MTWGTVELEVEVRTWLESLPTELFARVAFYVDLLAERGPLLDDRDAMRISYWIATDRRIILLTVFRKSGMREVREIDRARRAYRKCVEEAHTVLVTEED